MRSLQAVRYVRFAALAAAVWVSGCGGEEQGSSDPVGPRFARGGAGVRVDAADPPYGEQGAAAKPVSILGSGFQPGDQASWQRNGVADPKIVVVSTDYVSSTTLIATIDIALDAEIAYYDISVSGPGRKGGIGTEMFEVTTAHLLPMLPSPNGTAIAWGMNDAGDVVGRSDTRTVYWPAAGGVEDLGQGTAFDIDATSQRIVGASGNAPAVWIRGSGAWTRSALSTVCVSGANDGVARAISSDGTSAVGWVSVTVKGKSKNRPVAWSLSGSSCSVLPLAAPSHDGARVFDLSDTGVAVGTSGNLPVVWTGGVAAILGLLTGDNEAHVRGINNAGDLAVGFSGGRAVFWRLVGGTWSAPVELVSGSWADDANDGGLIGGKGFDGSAWYWQLTADVVTSSGPLGGLGQKESGYVEAVSNDGTGPRSMAGWSAGPVYWTRP